MSKPGATKEKLIQVAFDLIWNSSYSTVSVGDICDRAGVNKGSFYHFFESKTELAVEAYEHLWNAKRAEMDSLFSPQNAPLERIHLWCEWIKMAQKQKAEQYGRVCGCPFVSIGAEMATIDEKLRVKIGQLLGYGKRYLENTIADAVRQELVEVDDVGLATQRVCSVCLGMMVEAKVQNNLAVLSDMEPAILNILGIKKSKHLQPA